MGKNLSRSASEEQYQAIANEFNRLVQKQEALEAEITEMEARRTAPATTGDAVAKAMRIAHHLSDLVGRSNDYWMAKDIFDATNARMFFRFEPARIKNRVVNNVAA